VNLEMGGQRAQVFSTSSCAPGAWPEWQSDRNELGRLLLLGREAHQPQALRAVLNERDQAQCFGFTALVGVCA
jgi:hypothetical protein